MFAQRKGKKSVSDKFRYRDWKTGLLMLLPAFVILFIFGTIPLIMAVYRSFQDYNTGLFVAFQNFSMVLSDVTFVQSFGNVFLMGAVCVVLMMSLSFLFAHLILKLPKKFGGIVKILIYIPCIISGVVTAIIYTFLMNYGGGLFTSILLSLGLDPIAFTKEGIWPYVCIIVPTVWGGLGYNTLIMLAGLLDIPKTYYEAAQLSLLLNPLIKIFTGELPYFTDTGTEKEDSYKLSIGGRALYEAFFNALMRQNNTGICIIRVPIKTANGMEGGDGGRNHTYKIHITITSDTTNSI